MCLFGGVMCLFGGVMCLFGGQCVVYKYILTHVIIHNNMSLSATKDTLMSDITFFKPNELIGAIDQIAVSRTAKHLLNFFLQYAQSQIKFHGHTSSEFTVDVSQINGLADIHIHDYARLKLALTKLIQPVILRDDPNRFIALAPITSIDIDVQKGLYVFELQTKVVKLLEQTDYFTQLQLSDFNPLESKHSIVIYEYLKRYETAQQIPQISVDELRQITHTADKQTYANFAALQRRVLDVAVAEISDKTPYTVSYETIKTHTKYRPKVTAVKFSFKKKDNISGYSGIVTAEIEQVHSKYAELADKYAAAHRATREDFFRATYKVDYKCLLWFYENKHLPLRVLLDDIHTGRRQGRWNNQIIKYQTLVSELELDLEARYAIETGRKQQGFLEQVLKMQISLNDTHKLDIDKWM